MLEHGASEHFRLFCKTCPYVFNIEHKVSTRVSLQRKQVDDVLGDSASMENVDQTDGKNS